MADIFVAYATADEAVVARLADALRARGREVELGAGDIAGAEALCFVLSPDSLADAECRRRLDAALALNKRVIPVVVREPDGAEVPERLAAINWIFLREFDDFDTSVQSIVTALDTDLEWLHAHTRLLVRTSEWRAKAEDKNLLLRGIELDEAETWMAEQRKDPEPTPDQAAFVLTSRRASIRRQRGFVTTSVAITVVVLLLASVALVQRSRAADRANLATSRELALRSIEVSGNDRQLALILALRAWDAYKTPEAQSAVRASAVQLEVATLAGHDGQVNDAAISPDGRTVATVGFDGAVRTWEAGSGKVRWSSEPSDSPMLSVAWSPDGKRIAAGNTDAIRVLESGSGKVDRTLKADAGAALAFVNTDVLFVAGPSAATLWDVMRGSRIGAQGITGITDAEVSAAARLVAMATPAGAWIWDLKNGGQLSYTLNAPVKGFVAKTVALSRDGKTLLGADLSGRLVRWNLGDPTSKAGSTKLSMVGVFDIELSPDGKLVATATDDGKIDVRNADTGYNVVLAGHDSAAITARFSSDGTRLVTSSSDGTARVWNISGYEGFVPRGLRSGANGGRAAVSADGRVVAASRGDNAVVTVPYDDPNSPRVLSGLPGGDEVVALALSRNGNTIAAATIEGSVIAWDSSGVVRRSFGLGRRPGILAVSPDGKRLAVSGYESSAIEYDLELGTVAQTIETQTCVSALTYSRDGKRLAVGHCEGSIAILELARDRETRLDGHTGGVGAIRFRPDGGQLASVSNDGTIRLWDLKTRRGKVVPNPVSVGDIAYVAGGEHLLTVGSAGVVDIWDITSAHPIAVAIDQIQVADTRGVSISDTSRIVSVHPQYILFTACHVCGSLDSVVRAARSGVIRELTPDEQALYIDGRAPDVDSG